jgi:hypothetical protein
MLRRTLVPLALVLLAAPAALQAASARAFAGATLDGTMTWPNGNASGPQGQTVRYAVQPLFTSAATTCTFRSIQQTPGNGWLFLYEGGFNPQDPGGGILVASNDDGELGPGSSTLSGVALDPAKSYTLVTATGATGHPVLQFTNFVACTGSAAIVVGNGSMPTDGTAAEFRNGRFRVSGVWRAQTGPGTYVSGTMKYTPLGSGESGVLWTENPNDWVVLLKVLDGCAINNKFWVFYAATTNIEFTITVVDTVTNVTKSYSNPINTPAAPVTDTQAFQTCQ